jgi:uncharacterized membrane protein (UPF0127 family)
MLVDRQEGESDLLKPIHVVVLAAVATVAIIFAATNLRTADEEGDSEEVWVSFALADGGSLNISCEVADTSYERAEGLQYREMLPTGSGMLFVYDEAADRTFIMQNMRFPVDIIFIAENGTVLNVEEAEVEEQGTPYADLVDYCSEGPAKWVVEINQGLSQQWGIGPGTRVKIGPTG